MKETIVSLQRRFGAWFVRDSEGFREDAYPASDSDYELDLVTVPVRLMDALARDGWKGPVRREGDDQ